MFFSAPDRIRTCDLCLRRATLYPAELRAQDCGRRCKPSSVPRRSGGGSFLWDRRCRRPLAAYPGFDGAGSPSSPIWPCSGWGLPCRPCCQWRGALLPHRFTLACAPETGAIGGLFSVALSVASRRPAVSRHPALRSSDFPRHPRVPRSSLVSRIFKHRQCPGEDSNLHAVSGTRSLVWPVYQFQHLGIPTRQNRESAPERTRTSTGLRPLDPESSASTNSATGASRSRPFPSATACAFQPTPPQCARRDSNSRPSDP